MRTVWSLLVGLLLLFTVRVDGLPTEPFATTYSCDGSYDPTEYRENIVADALLRAISLVAPSNSFAKDEFHKFPPAYESNLKWLYRDGVGRGETHTYTLWGEMMAGLAVLWFLIAVFFYLPLMCFKWLRRRCCPFAWKRPRTEFGCGLWTLTILAPIALFLVAVAILYSVWFLQDLDSSKCLVSHGVDALYFGIGTDFPGLQGPVASGPTEFRIGVELVTDVLDRILGHLTSHDTGYTVLAISLIVASALSVLGVVFGFFVFYHYWAYEEYTNPIKPPGGFCTNLAGFLVFGYAFWGSLLLLASGVGFAFLYFPSDLCRFVRIELLENGKWMSYRGVGTFTNVPGLPECLTGEDVEWPDGLLPTTLSSPGSRRSEESRQAVEQLLASCGKTICFEPSCQYDPNIIQASTLAEFKQFVQGISEDDLGVIDAFPSQFGDIISCTPISTLPIFLADIDSGIVPLLEASDFSCPLLNELMDNTTRATCNMLSGDLGALAWIYFGLAILNFVCWIFITRFYKARRRLMDGLKGDQSQEPEPIPIAVGGGRITEDAFLLAAEQGDRSNVALGIATYPPNTVYDLLYNNSPLHLAAYYGHEDIVDSLLKEGYDPNDLNFHDYTPFSACASNTFLEFPKKHRLLQKLHAAGADLDTFDHQGDTALINATRNKDEELVRVLLEMGADPLIRDTMMGLTPLAVAETQRSPELVTLISEASPRAVEMSSPKRTRFSESEM